MKTKTRIMANAFSAMAVAYFFLAGFDSAPAWACLVMANSWAIQLSIIENKEKESLV